MYVCIMYVCIVLNRNHIVLNFLYKQKQKQNLNGKKQAWMIFLHGFQEPASVSLAPNHILVYFQLFTLLTK